MEVEWSKEEKEEEEKVDEVVPDNKNVEGGSDLPSGSTEQKELTANLKNKREELMK